MKPTTLSSGLLILSFALSGLLLNNSITFLSAVIVLFESFCSVLSYILSLCLNVHALFSWPQWISFLPLFWTLYLVRSPFISILLRSVSGVSSCSFVWNIFLCFFIFSGCVDFYTMDKTAISPSVDRLVLYRRWTLSAWPEPLVVFQSLVIVQTAFFVLSGSQ